jgi:N6-L-threonylcarbamoyladenine synthase
MIVLGIETSCDETAVAVVNDARQVLSHVILSQLDDHRPYGGVVPEIAARAHLDHLDGLVKRAMDEANVTYSDIDGIAATAGPGLIGGVMVGLMTAKAIALATGKPLLAVNHLEAHALTARLTDDVQFPFLLLLVSGGHCQILHVYNVGEYKLLGQTIDDAVGEAFDKVAKMLGLPYPGGPELEKLLPQANAQNAAKIDLPRPLLGRKNSDFSFAGLKTATRQFIGDRVLSLQEKADFSLAFHICIADILTDRLGYALQNTNEKTLVVAGGVAANQFLKMKLQDFCRRKGVMNVITPPIALCTDNAAMIAWAGIEKLRLNADDDLDIAARPRWPLYHEDAV